MMLSRTEDISPSMMDLLLKVLVKTSEALKGLFGSVSSYLKTFPFIGSGKRLFTLTQFENCLSLKDISVKKLSFNKTRER